MPDPSLGHQLSQRLEVKLEAITCVPEMLLPLPTKGPSQPGDLPLAPAYWHLASLSLKTPQGPPLLTLHLQGARMEHFLHRQGNEKGTLALLP